MLVLSRKTNEGLTLSNRETGEVLAKFRIANVRGDRVTVTIDAPEAVKIVRDEIANRLARKLFKKPEGNPDAT